MVNWYINSLKVITFIMFIFLGEGGYLKEFYQPQVPLRLPWFDFRPISQNSYSAEFRWITLHLQILPDPKVLLSYLQPINNSCYLSCYFLNKK